MAVTAKIKGAIIYTRVSTDEQDKHGTSPESQLEACRLKALALGLPIIGEYHDGGISGAWLSQRPGMMKAIGDIQTGRADTLICANMSRYSRDTEHQSAILKAITAAGGRIVFCDITFDDTPEGKMMFNFMGGYAEYERNVIRKRTYGGFVNRAENGIQSARATSPFGYCIPKKVDVLRGLYPAEQLGQYIILEDQARIVREVFQKYASGTYSLNQIAKELNAAAVPTPGGGVCWRSTNLHFMFKNPVYKGVAVFGRFDHSTDENRLGQTHIHTGRPLICSKTMRPADPETWITFDCPAIVSEQLWDRCNELLITNKSKKSGNPNIVRMLAGRINCPKCGAGMYCMSPSHKKSKKPGSDEVFTYPARYACGQYRIMVTNLGKGKAECVPTGYYADAVERAVVTSIEDACKHSDWIAALSAEYQKESTPAVDTGTARRELAAIDKALKDIAGDEAAAVQAQIAGIRAGASPDAYAEVFAALAGRRKDLEDRRGVVSKAVNVKPKAGQGKQEAADTGSMLEDVQIALTSEHVPGHVKRDILGTVIEKVIPFKDGPGKEGAEVFYIPGVFGEDTFPSTVGTSSDVPEINRFRAGKCQGSGRSPIVNSDSTAPPPSAISRNRSLLAAGYAMSTPHPKYARVRPPPSIAPLCARVSTPDAPPEMTDKPCCTSSRANCRARSRP